jgi:hypothetical protein
MNLYEIKQSVKKRLKKIYRHYFEPGLINSYSRVDLEEKTRQYNTEIQLIIKNAHKYQTRIPDDRFTTEHKTKMENYTVLCSLADVLGKVIVTVENNEKYFYRGIFPEKIGFFKELYECGVLQSLAESGRVVQIKLTDFYTEEFPLIVQMETLLEVPPNFWSFSMIRDSAVNILIINSVLKAYGYTLIDGHPFNSFFRKNKSVFFDLGSFVKSKKEIFKEQFYSYYVNTLTMLSVKKSYYARHRFCFYNIALSPESVDVDNSIEMKAVEKMFLKHHRRYSSREYNRILKKVFLQKDIKPEFIDVLFPEYIREKAVWGNYSNAYFTDKEIPGRQRRIMELTNEYSSDAKSTLDIAGNSGYFSSLLEQTGRFNSIISVDYDEHAIETGRILLKEKNVSLFLMNPFTPLFLKDNIQNISRIIQADMVFALALTHHLILSQRFDINAIFAVISMYSKKYVYIEFCPLGLYSDGKAPPFPDWYNEDWFESNFKRHFKMLHKEVVDRTEKGQALRILFIGILERR